MKSKTLVHVGSFGQAKGLKGEVNINVLTSTDYSFRNLKNYFNADGKEMWNFKYIKGSGKKLIGLLENYTNREDALTLNGKKIFSLRHNFPKINDDQYYIVDLIDCIVKNKKNKKLGVVTNVHNFGASDLLEIKNNDKMFYIPLNEENLISVQTDKKTSKSELF